MAGITLAGKYRLKSILGSGGAGYVYEAEHIDLQRTVAVKLLRRERLRADSDRFEIEARAASRINHPNAIAVYDFGVSDDGVPFLVMEHLRGGTLTAAIEDHLVLDRVVSIAAQILSALEEAHECGVVHRDLKSDNIVLERLNNGDDFVKVIDFGLALVAGSEIDEDGICGTPEYMAPEQIKREAIGPPADIYAVGIILYEMIVGRTPFAGGSIPAMLRDHLYKAPERANAVIPACPETLADVIARALAKEPADRWPSASAMRGALLGSRADLPQHNTCPTCATPNVASHRYCANCGALINQQPAHASSRVQVARGKGKARDRAATTRTSRLQFNPVDAGVFVGRGAELAQLDRFYRRGELCATTAVVGPTGSGKARLVMEAARRSSDDCTTFFAAADPSGLRTAWYPVLSMLEAVLGLHTKPSMADLSAAVARCGLPDRDAPGLAELFAVHGPLEAVELAVRRREAHAATLRALRSAERRFPNCVLCFADVDRYDDPSMDFISALSESLDGSGVRLIVTASEEDCVPPGALTLDLPPLSADETHELASRLADDQLLPSPVELHTRTGGSPAAIETLVAWVSLGHAVANAPSQLVDLVSSLLCNLPAVSRRHLQAIAVHGAVAPVELFERTLGEVDAGTYENLADLSRAMLLSMNLDELTIPSDLVAGAVYACTPADVRRRLHRRAVAAYSELELPVSSGVLAHHAECAGMHDIAFQYMMTAGDDAVRRFDDHGATDWYGRAAVAARRLMASGDQRAEAQLVDASVHLADVLRFTGQIGLAEGTLDEAEMMHPPPAQMAAIVRARGRVSLAEQQVDNGCASFRIAIGLALRTGDWDFACDTYVDLAGALAKRGNPTDAATQLTEGIDVITMGEGLDARTTIGRLWLLGYRLAKIHLQAGQLGLAEDVATRSLAHVEAARSPQGRGRIFALLAKIAAAGGRPKEALAYRARAIDELRRVGDRRSTAELLIENARAGIDAPAHAGRKYDSTTSTAARIAHDLASEIGWREGVEQAAEVEAQRILS